MSSGPPSSRARLVSPAPARPQRLLARTAARKVRRLRAPDALPARISTAWAKPSQPKATKARNLSKTELPARQKTPHAQPMDENKQQISTKRPTQNKNTK